VYQARLSTKFLIRRLCGPLCLKSRKIDFLRSIRSRWHNMICWSLVGTSERTTNETNYWKLLTSAASSVSHGQKLCSRTMYPRFDLIRRSISWQISLTLWIIAYFLSRPRKIARTQSLRNVAVAKIFSDFCEIIANLWTFYVRNRITNCNLIWREGMLDLSGCEWNLDSAERMSLRCYIIYQPFGERHAEYLWQYAIPLVNIIRLMQ